MPSPAQTHVLPLLFTSIAGVMVLVWWLDGRPAAMPDAPAERLACVSYSPSGATDGLPRDIAPERIRADLAMLAQRFDCVRTYSVSHGLDRVPDIAGEFGLQVLLGAWIGRDPELNEAEVALTLAVARRNRDHIRAIVVGNEVLLRHELTPTELAGLIRRVRAESGLPVTYADVWGFWVRHRALAEAVSFVTVHIIPYWDDVPVGIDEVIPYVDRLYAEMHKRFPGKDVLIGETGWPSVGRPRGANVPSRVNQARFIREFTVLAAERGIPYNLIEAFDQPWKRGPEGTVGGYWGIHDARGVPKFPLTGSMAEVGTAQQVLWCAGGLGVLGLAFGAARFRTAGPRAAVICGAAAVIAVTVGIRQWTYLVLGNLHAVDWIATLAVAATGWLALALVIGMILTSDNDHSGRGPAPRGLLATWRARRAGIPGRSQHATLILSASRFVLLLSAAYVSLGLVFAGRHRDFPLWLFLPGILAIVAGALYRPRALGAALRDDRAIEELLLAIWLVMAAVLIPWQERFANVVSIAWAMSILGLGLAILVPIRLQATGQQQPSQHADA